MSLTSLTSVCPVQSTSSLCMAVSTPSFLVLSKGPTGQFQAQPHLFSNGHRFSTVVCLSPEWHTVPKCLTPGSQLKSKHLERNCHHIPTYPPKVLAKSVWCVLSTYPLYHVPLVARFVTSVMISNNWAIRTSVAPTI